MSEKNLLRSISSDGSAYVLVCNSTEIVRRASDIHNTSKTMTATLGRSLTAASLMGALMKSPDNSLTLQFKGDGPAGTIVCVSDYHGNVRGYAQNPQAELAPNSRGKLDVGGSVGAGTMYVVRDLGMEEPYVGLCPIKTGEIAEDITDYFVRSEQIPTACGLGVHVNRDNKPTAAGGFLVQILPGAVDEIVAKIEENVGKIPPVSDMVLEGLSPAEIADRIFEGIEHETLDEAAVEYKCTCSREKYRANLRSIAVKELQSLIDENEPVETVCGFCGKKYVFKIDEVKKMLDEKLAVKAVASED